MERHIKDEKWKDFIKDFENNPEKLCKDQIENDWEFDEETQLKIIEECFYDKNYEYSIKFIKNPKEKAAVIAFIDERIRAEKEAERKNGTVKERVVKTVRIYGRNEKMGSEEV